MVRGSRSTWTEGNERSHREIVQSPHRKTLEWNPLFSHNPANHCNTLAWLHNHCKYNKHVQYTYFFFCTTTWTWPRPHFHWFVLRLQLPVILSKDPLVPLTICMWTWCKTDIYVCYIWMPFYLGRDLTFSTVFWHFPSCPRKGLHHTSHTCFD